MADADLATLSVEVDFSSVEEGAAALEKLNATAARSNVTFSEFENDLGLIDRGLMKATESYKNGEIAAAQYLNTVRQLQQSLAAEVAGVSSSQAGIFGNQITQLQNALSAAAGSSLSAIPREADAAEAALVRTSRATERLALGFVMMQNASAGGVRGLSSMASAFMILFPEFAAAAAAVAIAVAGFELLTRNTKTAEQEIDKLAETYKNYNRVRLEVLVAQNAADQAAINAPGQQTSLPGWLRDVTAAALNLISPIAGIGLASRATAGDVAHLTEVGAALAKALTDAADPAKAMAAYVDQLTIAADKYGMSATQAAKYDLALQHMTASYRTLATAEIDRLDHLQKVAAVHAGDADILKMLQDIQDALAAKVVQRENDKQAAIDATNQKILEQAKAVQSLADTYERAWNDKISRVLQGMADAQKAQDRANAADGASIGRSFAGGVLGMLNNPSFASLEHFISVIPSVGPAASIVVGALHDLIGAFSQSRQEIAQYRLAQMQLADAMQQLTLQATNASQATRDQIALQQKVRDLKFQAEAAAGFQTTGDLNQDYQQLLAMSKLQGPTNALIVEWAKKLLDQLASIDATGKQALSNQSNQQQITSLQSAIATLSNTLSVLSGFSSGLSLNTSLTTLSPAAQLEAARQQYQTVLAAARAGDQSAASQLPQAAQAFLTASRSYNASGLAYVSDFNQVQSDTAAVIKLFQDQKDTAQKQLDALTYVGTLLQAGNDAQDTQTQVLVAGFEDNGNRLDKLESAIGELTRTMKNNFAAAALRN